MTKPIKNYGKSVKATFDNRELAYNTHLARGTAFFERQIGSRFFAQLFIRKPAVTEWLRSPM